MYISSQPGTIEFVENNFNFIIYIPTKPPELYAFEHKSATAVKVTCYQAINERNIYILCRQSLHITFDCSIAQSMNCLQKFPTSKSNLIVSEDPFVVLHYTTALFVIHRFQLGFYISIKSSFQLGLLFRNTDNYKFQRKHNREPQIWCMIYKNSIRLNFLMGLRLISEQKLTVELSTLTNKPGRWSHPFFFSRHVYFSLFFFSMPRINMCKDTH